jgi:hypothetical protein
MVLPIMGKSIDTAGPQATLKLVSILPAILIVLFVVVNLYMRNKKRAH